MGHSQAEEPCELVVVGAGLAALHLVARLPDNLLQGTLVVDSAGTWLASWSAACERLAAPHVRAPVTQHPHASPGALQAWAEKQGRQQELVPVVKGFASVPTTALFRDFCRSKVMNQLPSALRAPLADTVVALEPLEGGASSASPGCRVRLESGRVLTARAVVWTPANRRPVLPAWTRQLASAEGAADAGATDGQQPAVDGTLGGTVSLPPGIATSDCVDLRGAELEGRRVAVVGGGMSAGLLAAGAAERGAHVMLVCRRPVKPQAFETEVGWWGAKQLNGYRQMQGAAPRIKACQRARRQGSVHLPVWRRLVQQAVAGRLTVREGWEVTGAERQPHVAAVADELDGDAASWLLALKRREAADAAQPAAGGPTTFQQAVAAATAAATAAASADSVPATAAAAEATATKPPGEQSERQLSVDQVWLACGSAYAASTDPVLCQLAAAAPAPLTGGYPWLDDNHLCWPGAAVYLIGRGALLSVGPCAGDLPGMRLAADRVVASLRRLDYATAPVWHTAAEQLLTRLLPGSAAGGGSAKEAASGLGQLAAAVAAAQAADGAPLEAEGLPFEEPIRPKVSVARPDHLIDVSDLDPGLPRKELQRYTFTDDGFELCVICQLEEPVPLEQVRTLFGEQRLEMWAVGASAGYRLHLPRLYGRVIPKKCSVKVNQKACKVYLLLQKEADAEWRFLKG